MNNRAGCFIRNLSGDMAYESFKPSPLPPTPPIELDEDMLEKLIEANKNIAVLESLSSRIPNAALFVSRRTNHGRRQNKRPDRRDWRGYYQATEKGVNSEIQRY